MVPDRPTATNNTVVVESSVLVVPVVVELSVLVVLDELLDEVQDMGDETKKKYGEDYEYMSHLVSYLWFRRTQYITSIGLFYKNRDFTWRCV